MMLVKVMVCHYLLILHRHISVSQTQGPLFRIGPNNVATADPAMVVKMGAVKSPYRRSSIYHALRFRPGSDNLLSTRDEDVHRKLKAKTAAGVSEG